ncbi:hypothetical protein [Flavobacterium sp. ASW18X]|uniref:hypothetical protein n=1 Tax=Flavobacterium sp. ASW18X TaxID=2572595 RepID=UPI0010AE14CC|nr:hypothetical protein [Flavobacterium sp. ASW18X]TKD65981.1 hypothetical protein FBT53_03695 [Flavobacterium sp. ASW18X]
MTRKLLFPLLAMVVVLISCSDETTVFEENDDNLVVEQDASVLENSLNFEDSGVLDFYPDQSASSKYAREGEEQAGDYPLSLVAQINPPSYSGAENLTASHIHLVNDYVYVSYNTAEDDYAGAMDIIYVGDPYQPRVTSRLYYTNADINSIKYENGFVYAAGGVDAEQSATADANSFLAKIPVANGRFNTDAGISYAFQEGFNATDVALTNAGVYVTSGKDGYIRLYDKSSLEMINEAAFQDLRSLAINNDKIAVLDASYGVRVLNSDFSQASDIAISGDFREADKRTLDYYGELIVVAEGQDGAGVYNAATGNLVQRLEIPISPENVEQGDIVTNAAAFNENILLMANGGAGLCLSEDDNGVDLVGIIALDGSINYVETKDDYIFAASGRGGLQIIKMNKPSQSLEESCVDTSRYSGSSNLTVASNQNLGYNGSNRFNSITVEGQLLLCGTWAVRNDVKVDKEAAFDMRGTLIVGRNSDRKDVIVEENATLRIEGDFAIYGNLILKKGASLEFLGDANRAYITGTVTQEEGTTVTGEFNDMNNRF